MFLSVKSKLYCYLLLLHRFWLKKVYFWNTVKNVYNLWCFGKILRAYLYICNTWQGSQIRYGKSGVLVGLILMCTWDEKYVVGWRWFLRSRKRTRRNERAAGPLYLQRERREEIVLCVCVFSLDIKSIVVYAFVFRDVILFGGGRDRVTRCRCRLSDVRIK